MTEGQGTTPAQEIYATLAELRGEPYGQTRSARTEEVVEAAEQLGQEDVQARALLELLTAYEYGNEIHKAPVLFSRILKLYQDKPESFDEWTAHRVFWCFKWITSALMRLPEIPLPAIEGWIAQMQEHFVAAGKPLQAVRTSRFHLASHIGVGEDLAYELWATRPRDEFSDCEACEARNRGAYWSGRGEDERALREWQPVLDGKLSCAEEPASTISHALLPLVRQGRLEEAASCHRSGYRATRGQVSMNAQTSRHLEFLALTGNSARGLELLAENRGRLGSATHPQGRLSLLGGVEVLLRRLAAEGNGQVPVTGLDGRACTVAALLDEVTAEAQEIAARFDARNGTGRIGDGYRARTAREPLTSEPLPLGMRVAGVAAALSAPSAPPKPAPDAAPVPEDFAALLAEARAALAAGRPGADRLWEVVAERAPETELDDLLRAELADRAGFRLVQAAQWAEAAAELRESAELFERAGKPGRAVSRRSRAGWAAFVAAGAGRSGSWEELDATLAAAEELEAREQIAAEDRVIVQDSRAGAAMAELVAAAYADGSPDAAVRARFEREVEALREIATRLGRPGRAAVAEAMASEALAHEGRLEEGLARVDEALTHAQAAEQPWTMPRFLAQRGRVLTALGRLDEAAAEQHRALALLAEWPDAEGTAGVLMELANNRMRADDVSAAIGHLTTAAAGFDQRGEAGSAANARALLGQALLRANRLADAIAVLESLLDEEGEAELPPAQRAQLRLDLGRALLEQDEPRTAVEVLTGLAEFVTDWPDRAVVTLAAAEVGCAVYAAGLWEQGQATVERALASHAEAPNPAMLGKLLRVAAQGEFRNRGAEGLERALEYLRRADEINAATEEVVGDYQRWPETALNAEARVQALGSAGRDEEALAAADAACAAWELGGDRVLGELAESVRVAAILEGLRLGRAEAAVARLSPMIGRCRAAGHERAVTVLTKLAEDVQRR